MKKNAFLEGAVIATLSIVLSKVLGIIYVIPFYSLIGEKGGALYGYAYSIYGLFLNLSTAGIPLAISKITSEYSALNQNYLKEKSYKISKYLMCSMGCVCFIILMFFAPVVADLFIGNIEGGNTKEDVAFVIRVISTALLIVPILSVTRGYLQGHKYITPSSVSQVIEQFVRVIIIVIGSYLSLKVFNLSLTTTIGIAVFSATISALCAYIYLKIKVKNNKKDLIIKEKITKEEEKISTKDLTFKLLSYALPFILIDFVSSMYSFVDLSTINKTMVSLGYSINDAESVISILTTWGSKLNVIVMAVSSGMIVSLIPNIASSYIIKDYKDVRTKINQALSSLIFVVLPMTVGLSLIAKPIWTVFFGSSSTLGPLVFSYSIFTAFTLSIFNVTMSTMHSLGFSKVVILTLGAGLISKVILNVPLMNLFNNLQIHASFGVITSTILSNIVAIICNMLFLKKKLDIKYTDTIKKILKTLIPLISMIIVVMLFKQIIPSSNSRVICFIYSCIYGLIGALVYFVVAFKTHLINDIFGNDFLDKIKNKIKKEKQNKEKGFTLVELLAVIVILAILYTFLIPKLNNIINDNNEKEIIEKEIINSAREYANNFDKSFFSKFYEEGDINYICKEDLLNNHLIDEDDIKKLDNFIAVKGVLNSKDKITYSVYYSNEELDVCKITFAEYITNNVGNDGLKKTSATYNDKTYDAGIRYTGANPNNYVKFNCDDDGSNCEIWRIIGVFDVDGEKRVKIINTSSTFRASWDSSAHEVNNGYGINQWGPSTYVSGEPYEGADLYQLLNGFYINQNESECKYNNRQYKSTLMNTCSAESLTTVNLKPLTSSAKNLISNATWYTYAVSYNELGKVDSTNASSAYLQEIGVSTQHTGKECSGEWCTDSVVRTTAWNGLVGLMSTSDIGFCEGWLVGITITPDIDAYHYWGTLDDFASRKGGCSSGDCEAGGNIMVEYKDRVNPTVYLNADVVRVNGDGTSSNPYILK